MYDVVAIGTVVRDVYLRSEHFKTFKDSEHLKAAGFPTGEAQCFPLGGKIRVEEPVLTIGGGAVNTSISLARQGHKTAALVKVGDDKNGHGALDELKEEGVEPLSILDKENMTGYSAILLDKGGERTILTYRGASNAISESEVPFQELQSKWAYIVPGRIPFETMMKLISHFQEAGAKIAMDLSKTYLEMGAEKLEPILSSLDVVKMNREEAALLTGKPFDNESEIFKASDELVKGIGVMTDGPNGVLVSDGKKIYKAGVYQEERIVDRLGAGDAFGAGFVSALVHTDEFAQEDIERAIRLGSANSTSVVEHIGGHTGALTKEAFENEERWKVLPITIEEL